MREAVLILPNADNAGESVSAVHTALSVAILEAFGGYSAADVRGAWRDESTGAVYSDESTEYRIAADWNPEQVDLLERLAARYGFAAGQIAVYVRHATGRVVFVPGADAADASDDSTARAIRKQREAQARKAERLAKFGAREAVAA